MSKDRMYEDGENPVNIPEPTISMATDVEGVDADAWHQHGEDKFPIFNVSSDEFFQNQSMDRKRIRFKSGSSAQKYHMGTRHKRPFYIRAEYKDGKILQREIK